MPSSSIRARAPKPTQRGAAGNVANNVQRDPDVLAGFIEDAAHFPGGYADGLVAAACEADIANLLRGSLPVLAIGAQSSLTRGGAPKRGVLFTPWRPDHHLYDTHDALALLTGVTTRRPPL